MRLLNLAATFLIMTTLLLSCKKEAKKINPADANALQSVLVIPGGELVTGNPPSPTGTSTSPVVNSSQSTGSTLSGEQASIPFSFSSRAGYTNCYAQVRGASNGYFIIPANNAANNGTIRIPINIPANVADGEFCIQYCIADATGRVSNILEFCVTVIDNSDSGGSGTGSGTFTIGGQTFSGPCISVPSVVNGVIDVTIVTTSGSSFNIYRMPTGSSGNTAFGDGGDQTGTFGLVTTNGGFWGTRAGGTVTKTASNKFTFSGTVYDLITNQSQAVSGNGTY